MAQKIIGVDYVTVDCGKEGFEKYIKMIENPVVRGLLFGWDRISCCERMLVLYSGLPMRKTSKVIGFATFAPEGEQNSGEPTVVGMVVLPEFRRQGWGLVLMKEVAQWLLREGLVGGEQQARIDAMSRWIPRIHAKLEWKEKHVLRLVDYKMYPMDMMGE